MKNLHCEGVSHPITGVCGGVTLSLETLINAKDNHLYLRNNLTLVNCAFPGNLLQLTPHLQHILLSLAEDGF